MYCLLQNDTAQLKPSLNVNWTLMTSFAAKESNGNGIATENGEGDANHTIEAPADANDKDSVDNCKFEQFYLGFLKPHTVLV